MCVPCCPAGYLEEAQQHYCFGVNAGIVHHQATTATGAIHLQAANIKAGRPKPIVPDCGCAPLPVEGGRCLVGWDGAVQEESDLPPQPLPLLVGALQHCSMLAQPRLLGALQAYQRCLDPSTLVLVDTQLHGLPCPAALSAFLTTQRLHLENTMEVLQCDWAIKVRPVNHPGSATCCSATHT